MMAKTKLNYDDFYKIAGVNQHDEFVNFLNDLIFKKEKREDFYRDLIALNSHLERDIFREYFELYSAERKTFNQDYTPDGISEILAKITRKEQDGAYTAYDPTAGTGSLIIQKWWDDLLCETPLSYAPHRYFYRADEMANNAIPFLIHNLAIRGMNAIVVHGDVLEGKAEAVYFLQNSDDDYLGFSDINIMPRSQAVMDEFGIREWIGEEVNHIESGKFVIRWALPMMKRAMEINTDPKPEGKKKEPYTGLRLKDVAEIERAKKNKIYPKDATIIQISATQGQIGRLVSSGEVEAKYAVIQFEDWIDPVFGFLFLKRYMPRHIHRVQEGLNIKLKHLGELPFCYPPY